MTIIIEFFPFESIFESYVESSSVFSNVKDGIFVPSGSIDEYIKAILSPKK